jgi:hypothetical protein
MKIAFKIIKEIADELGWNYSHGNLTETPFRSNIVYPMLHNTIQAIQLNEQTSQIQLNIIIADVVNYLKTENETMDLSDVYSELGYTENQNYINILNQLYMNFALKIREKKLQYNQDISFEFPIQMTPFIEADKDVLAGYNITLNINQLSPYITDCYDEISPN